MLELDSFDIICDLLFILCFVLNFVGYKNMCLFLTIFTEYGKAPKSECSKPCGGNKLETCGGVFRVSIYDLGKKLKKKK